MPLIANRDKRKKVKLEVEIVDKIHHEIVSYCEWAGVNDLGYFVEEAAKFVFAKDATWVKHYEGRPENK